MTGFQHRRTREGPAVFYVLGKYIISYVVLQKGGRKGQSFAVFCR
jgi:hypothetical protein